MACFPTPIIPQIASNQPIPPPPPYSQHPSMAPNTSAYPQIMHPGMPPFGNAAFMQQKSGNMMMAHHFMPDSMGGPMPFQTKPPGGAYQPPMFPGATDEMPHGMPNHQQIMQQQMMHQHAAMRFPHPGNMPPHQLPNFPGMQQNRM